MTADLQCSISDNIRCFLIHYLYVFDYIFLGYYASHPSIWTKKLGNWNTLLTFDNKQTPVSKNCILVVKTSLIMNFRRCSHQLRVVWYWNGTQQNIYTVQRNQHTHLWWPILVLNPVCETFQQQLPLALCKWLEEDSKSTNIVNEPLITFVFGIIQQMPRSLMVLQGRVKRDASHRKF